MVIFEEVAQFVNSQIPVALNEQFEEGLSPVERKLYQLLMDNAEVPMNRDSFVQIFDSFDHNVRYRLIGKLKKHSLSFTPSQSKHNSTQIAYFNCYINYAVIKFLFQKQFRNSAVQLARQNFYVAKKYMFNDVLVDCTKILFNHFSTYLGDFRKAKMFFELNQETHRALQLESKAEWYYSNLTKEFHKTKTLKQDFVDKSGAFYSELSKEFFNVNSWDYHKYSFLVGIFHYLSKKDFHGCLDLTDKAMNYFISLPFDNIFSLNIMRNYRSYSMLNLGMYNEAYATLSEVSSTTEPFKSQWYTVNEYLLKLDLRLKKYDEAYDRMNTAVNSKFFHNLADIRKERWRLYQAYMELVKNNLLNQKAGKNKAIITNYLNSKNNYFKDKEAMNLNLIILELLYYLVNNKLDDAIDKMDAVSRYNRRYLSKKNQFRSHCFLRMLLVIPRRNEHPEAVARDTDKLRKRLAEVEINLTDQAEEVEIIPYEDLWDLILKHLVYKYKRSKSHYEPLHPYLKQMFQRDAEEIRLLS